MKRASMTSTDRPCFFFQYVGGFQRAVERGADGEDRQVAAVAAHGRLALGHFVVAFGHAAFDEQLADVVEALALEEDHRVGAAQGQVEHALGVVGRGREDDLEARDVGDQMRRPVLGVLGAVLGAHRDAQHQRHLQHAGRHGLPLGELVEDLVAGAAHEVAVHQLGHDAAALRA